jgi:hypothetical protein
MITAVAVTVTTASDGSATGYTTPVNGRLLAIRYTPHGSTPLDTNADAVITGHTTGQAILTITNIGTAAASYYPRAATVGVTNAAALYAAAGTAVNCEIPLVDEAIKVVIAQGASTKIGTFTFLVES